MLFYYQGALAMSAKLRNVNRKIVHSASERKGIRFHRVLKHTDVSVVYVYVCVCLRFSTNRRNTLRFRFLIIFHFSEKWLVWLISFTFKRTGLLGCLS